MFKYLNQKSYDYRHFTYTMQALSKFYEDDK